MAVLLIFLLSVNPFYEANFSSLPRRSLSVLSNPGGLGIQPGAEAFFTYRFDPYIIETGVSLANLGLGMYKTSGFTYYESGVGYKLPGALSLGYAFQFGDTTNHVFGLVGHPTPNLSLGYTTTIGSRRHMFGGISIRPAAEYITMSCDLEYEGIDDIFNVYYGASIRPIEGLNLNFYADKDFNWNAGLEVSLGKIILAGAYSDADEKFSGGIILSAQSYKSVIPEGDKITTYTLNGRYPEIERKSFLGIPLATKQGFTKLLENLESVVERDDIQVMVMKLKTYSLGQAQIEELKNILTRIRNAGKKLIVFADSYSSTLSYEFACIGDEIILSPLGSVSIPGVAMRSLFVKGTLEKLGLEADVVHVGKYKSAAEAVSRTDMSDADREQTEKILDDFYYPMIDNIAQSRNKTTEEIEELINSIAYFNSDEAKRHGLIDTTLYESELEEYVKTKYGEMQIVDFDALVNERIVENRWRNSNPKIALVIAEGIILPGEGKPNFFQSSLIGGDAYARIFETIAKDNSIRAVVFRINSGGGDAFASEEITYAVKQCSEKKPVIVSMGDVAGSGGYYIACLADKVYADDRTITGSIGVLGINLVTKGLYDKLGISWDYVKRGEHSDQFWGLRHFTEDELAMAEREVKWWYDKFTKRVAQGRKMSQERVDSLGQGRIYSGTHAKQIGLVDETGGFLDALDAAKVFAGIKGEVDIAVYPRNLGFSFLNSNQQGRVLYLMQEYEIK